MGPCISKPGADAARTVKKKKKKGSTPEERYAAYKAPKEIVHEGALTGASSPGLLDPFELTDATTSSSTGAAVQESRALVPYQRTGSTQQAAGGGATTPSTSSSTTRAGTTAKSNNNNDDGGGSVNSPHYWDATNALVPIATARKGRALQSRLEKAKQMQLALSNSSNSSYDGCGGNGSSGSSQIDRSNNNNNNNNKRGSNATGNLQRTIDLDSPASAVALAPDGATAYVGTDDGRIIIYPTTGCNSDAAGADDRPRHRSVKLSSRAIRDICVLPTGTATATGNAIAVAVDDYCRILDGTSLEAIHSIRHDDRVYAVATVRQNYGKQYLAVAGFSSAVNLYSAASYEYERHIERPYGLILAMDAIADLLAIAGSDKTCTVFTNAAAAATAAGATPTNGATTTNQQQNQQQLWDLSYELRRLTTILAVAWSPTKHLAIASKDSIGVFLERALLYELTVHGTTGLAWSPSGRYLCAVSPQHSGLYAGTHLHHSFSSSSSDNEPYVAVAWGQRGTLVLAGETELQILRAGEATVDDSASLSTASYFSNRGDWVLKEDAFRDLDEPNPVIQEAPVESNIIALAFSKGSKFRPSSYMAVSTDDDSAHLVVIRNGTDYSRVAELEFPATVACLSFSHGSRYLALGCHDAHVYIYDTTATWELVTKIEFSDPIATLCFSVRNERLFVGSIDGTVAYLNVEQEFDFEDEIEGYESGVTSLDCSAKHFAAGRDEGIVTVFDIDRLGDPVAELHRDSPVTNICFGVNSRFLAVGDAEGLVGVYSAKGGWVLSHQIEMDNSICMVRWCAQGRHLAVSDVAGTMKVYDTIFWQEIKAARQPHATSGSKYLDFSQDGKLLAFGSDRVTVLEITNDWKPVLGNATTNKDDDHDDG